MQDVEKTEIQSQTSSKRRRRRNRFRPLYGLLGGNSGDWCGCVAVDDSVL